ncbi:hypothetical protein [Williamsia maris]|uniref:Uncharacterized protein n=1 Tax=Williamsia maris TaxID=72806 RepID=A0ABT1HCJ5_9NOCA|nr:hypothetical protein [Williamsia maris]MCP2175909.1 hypothetical protein [Williamsia maris]
MSTRQMDTNHDGTTDVVLTDVDVDVDTDGDHRLRRGRHQR